MMFLIMDTDILAVHDCFKHAASQDIFLLVWRQVLSYDVSLLNICLIVNLIICQNFLLCERILINVITCQNETLT
jgi:hypothetical protein